MQYYPRQVKATAAEPRSQHYPLEMGKHKEIVLYKYQDNNNMKLMGLFK